VPKEEKRREEKRREEKRRENKTKQNKTKQNKTKEKRKEETKKKQKKKMNRSWRPQLAVTAASGFPPMATAGNPSNTYTFSFKAKLNSFLEGNVLRPFSEVMLSLRIPPTLDPKKASDSLKYILEKVIPPSHLCSF